MSLLPELERLTALHAAGSLTDAEYAAAKAALLRAAADEGDGPSAGRSEGDDPRTLMHEPLEELRRANAVAELDREWSMAREDYMMTGYHDSDTVAGGHSYRYRPSRMGSVIGGTVATLFGCFWTFSAASMMSESRSPYRPSMGGGMQTTFDIFPLFGVVFILVGLWTAISGYQKATEYDQAKARYLRRRASILDGRSDPGSEMGADDDDGEGEGEGEEEWDGDESAPDGDGRSDDVDRAGKPTDASRAAPTAAVRRRRPRRSGEDGIYFA